MKFRILIQVNSITYLCSEGSAMPKLEGSDKGAESGIHEDRRIKATVARVRAPRAARDAADPALHVVSNPRAGVAPEDCRSCQTHQSIPCHVN